jgi:hypothetical protein
MIRELIYTILAICLIWQYSFALDCHPAVGKKTKNYIVGYGSLINSKSRYKTTPQVNKVYPILVKNYERVWGKHSSVKNATYLVIVPHKGQKFNAIYYEADAKEITKTDEREENYCRYKLNNEDIQQISKYKLKEGVYWVYAKGAKDIQPPTKNKPIIQSYVDIFISGCNEIQKKFDLKNFTKQCIKTTHTWEEDKWQNDREDPGRPLDLDMKDSKIDKELGQHL